MQEAVCEQRTGEVSEKRRWGEDGYRGSAERGHLHSSVPQQEIGNHRVNEGKSSLCVDRVKGRQEGVGAALLGWQQWEALRTPGPGGEWILGSASGSWGQVSQVMVCAEATVTGHREKGSAVVGGWWLKEYSSTAEMRLTQDWGPCWESLGKMNGTERGRRWTDEERGREMHEGQRDE